MQTGALRTMRRHGETGLGLVRPESKSAYVTLAGRNRALEEELSQVRREHDELRRTVFEAAHMQRRLCGSRQLQRGPYTLTSELFPVRHVSGDFISVFERSGSLIFAIGDIAGKGLAAGMWFTQMVGLIRVGMEPAGEPAAAMRMINRELCREEFAPPLTSLFIASLDLKSDVITYCNAGHPPSLVVRDSSRVEALQIGGPILGAVPEADYETATVRLKSGDTLLSYSDGLLECRNTQDEEFGTEGLLMAAQRSQHVPASSQLFSLLGAVEDFAGSGRREDDFAVLLLHRDETGRC